MPYRVFSSIDREGFLTSRQRVDCAVRFEKPDRVPQDFTAVPEIWHALGRHFNTDRREEILEKLGIDCRMVSYEGFCEPPGVDPEAVDMTSSPDRVSTAGMWRKRDEDGLVHDVWGAAYRWVHDGKGFSEVLCGYPLENARSVEDLRRYRWPEPGWWDFKGLVDGIKAFGACHVRYRVGSVFETAWSLCGMEKFLTDLALQPALPAYVMERITEVHLENLKTVLEKAGPLIDMVYFYDDLASQQSLLISPDMYRERIRPFHRRIVDLAKRHGKPVMLHCCGAAFPLIETFIDMGVDVLNPIQPKAAGMAPAELSRAFRGRMAFHGGMDIQETLPRGTREQVVKEAAEVKQVLGGDGGYIFAPAHNIQADTPLANILAMYH